MSNPELPIDNIPTFEDVKTAYADVLDHNMSYTGFAAGLRNIIDAINYANENVPEGSPRDFYEAVKRVGIATTEGDMRGDLQAILHEATFRRIGIKLKPLGSDLSLFKNRMSSTELVPVIDNVELYTDFLSSVNPEVVQNDENGLALVMNVVTTLQKTVESSYGKLPDHFSEEQRQSTRLYGDQALKTFLKVDETYTALGLNNPSIFQRYIADGPGESPDDQAMLYDTASTYLTAYKTLEDYVIYWSRGVLPEFIEIGSKEYLSEDKTVYLYGKHDTLITKTDRIVNLINSDEKSDFGVESAESLLVGLAKTASFIREKPQARYSTDENRILIENLTTKLRIALRYAT